MSKRGRPRNPGVAMDLRSEYCRGIDFWSPSGGHLNQGLHSGLSIYIGCKLIATDPINPDFRFENGVLFYRQVPDEHEMCSTRGTDNPEEFFHFHCITDYLSIYGIRINLNKEEHYYRERGVLGALFCLDDYLEEINLIKEKYKRIVGLDAKVWVYHNVYQD